MQFTHAQKRFGVLGFIVLLALTTLLVLWQRGPTVTSCVVAAAAACGLNPLVNTAAALASGLCRGCLAVVTVQWRLMLVLLSWAKALVALPVSAVLLVAVRRSKAGCVHRCLHNA